MEAHVPLTANAGAPKCAYGRRSNKNTKAITIVLYIVYGDALLLSFISF
jgi:hypothetical protein